MNNNYKTGYINQSNLFVFKESKEVVVQIKDVKEENNRVSYQVDAETKNKEQFDFLQNALKDEYKVVKLELQLTEHNLTRYNNFVQEAKKEHHISICEFDGIVWATGYEIALSFIQRLAELRV